MTNQGFDRRLDGDEGDSAAAREWVTGIDLAEAPSVHLGLTLLLVLLALLVLWITWSLISAA